MNRRNFKILHVIKFTTGDIFCHLILDKKTFSKNVPSALLMWLDMGIMTCSWQFCDLFGTFENFLWPFQQFYDISVTFMTWLWHFQHFCDHFMNDKKGHNFMNGKMILPRSNSDLFVTSLWPVKHFYDLSMNDIKWVTMLLNSKMILSSS